MKKIISLMILAVSFIAFISCNNGNTNDNNNSSEEQTVTPAELLKNIPVTPTDFADMLKTDKASRVVESIPVILAEQDSISVNESKISTNSELLLFILKYCISQTEDFEFGKNIKIGVIGDTLKSARDDFLTMYSSDDVDIFLEMYATRDFGTVRVVLEDSKAVIFWHLASWSDRGRNFPEAYLYITGTYKNGKYENLAVYGEGVCYRYNTADWTVKKAVPVFEKIFVNDNKVIVAGQSLDDLDTIGNNNLYRIDFASDSYSGYSTSLDHNVTVVYKDASYITDGRLEDNDYECYVINPDGTLVLELRKRDNEYTSYIPLKYLSLPDGAVLYKEGSSYKLEYGDYSGDVSISNYNYNANRNPAYSNTSTSNTEYVKEPFTFTKEETCKAYVSKFIEMREKGLAAGAYATEFLPKTEREEYQKSLAEWKKTLSE